MGLKCLKNGKKSCLLPELWLKCNTWLFFVFSTDDSKKLVTAWEKHWSATERSSWVNMITRQVKWPHFFSSTIWTQSVGKFYVCILRPNSIQWGSPFAWCFGL